MHELSIALSILELAAEEAKRHEGRVAVIRMRLGPLSGVDKDALLSAYDLAREQSPLRLAELQIEDVPLTAFCATCRLDCTLDSPQRLSCPICGEPTPKIHTGRELEVVALEIES